MTTGNDSPKLNGLLDRMRDSVRGLPPDRRATLLVSACLICGIVGAWMVVKNGNMYQHRHGYHPGATTALGVVTGGVALVLGWHAAHKYRPHLKFEIPAWTGFSLGLIELLWLAGPILKNFLGPGAG